MGYYAFITKNRVQECTCYEETENEYILDKYPNQPEDIVARLPRFKKDEVLAICRSFNEVQLWLANKEDFKVVFEAPDIYKNGVSIRVVKGFLSGFGTQLVKEGKVVFTKSYVRRDYAIMKARVFVVDLHYIFKDDLDKFKQHYGWRD